MTTDKRFTVDRDWHDWAPAPGPEIAALPPDLRGLSGGVRRLSAHSVFVAGMGAVGGKVIQNLARLGVGELWGVDPDLYDDQSFRTQPCAFADADRSKAQVQGERAHAINPGIAIHTAQLWAQDVPFHVLRSADVWVTAGDNRELPVWLGVAAAGLGKMLIQGAVDGDSWTACVRVFDLRNAEQACPACGLSTAEWSQLRHRLGCGSLKPDPTNDTATQTMPNVCGMAADLVTAEILKQLLEHESVPCAGEEVAYCQQTHRVWRSQLPRNPACRCPHRRWTLLDVAADPRQLTLRSLQSELGIAPSEAIRVRAELPWVTSAVCPACDRRSPVRLFGHAGDAVGLCACGGTLTASPLGLRSVIPQDDFAACGDVPLSQLGVTPGTAVGISMGESWTYCFVGQPAEPARKS